MKLLSFIAALCLCCPAFAQLTLHAKWQLNLDLEQLNPRQQPLNWACVQPPGYHISADAVTVQHGLNAVHISGQSVQGPPAEAAIWVHNGHAAKWPATLGGYLHKHFGDQYYAIATVIGKGRVVNIAGAGTIEYADIIPPPRGSVEYNCTQLQQPGDFLPLRNTTQPDWLSKPVLMNILGVGQYLDMHYAWLATPAQSFDGIYYLSATAPAEMIQP